MARSSRDLTQGPVFGHILRLVVPMSFGIVAMMAVGVVDAYWVGKLGTAEQAAVQFVFPVSMAVMSISIGLGAGAVSVVSRAAGRGDHGRTARLATDAIALAFIVVLATSILGIAVIDPLFTMLGATEAMMPHVRDFMTIWFAGIVFIVGPMIASNLLRALGDAIIPSAIMILAAVLNMGLDPLMIFGWGPVPALGVQGAAAATLISNLVVFVISMAILVFREKLIDLTWPGWDELFWNWREIARVGLPASGSNMINPISMSIAFAAMARFGEAAVGGLGVAMRVEAFAIIPLFALSASIGPVAGQNGGAGHTDRVREAFARSFMFCAGWSLALAVVLFFLGGWLSGLFLPSAEGRAVAAFYWTIVPFTVMGYGIAMAASAGFNGLGRPIYGIAINIFRGFVLMAPLTWVIGSALGSDGVVYGIAAANLITAVLAVLFVLRVAPLTAHEGKARPAKAAKPGGAAAE
ncbi:MATE family efflux transporter [Marinicauda salina]|uniref:MATE family efflux transporter n=1 Tax=Marinicauda salina TaxID=2135793 RepID=A0A2U2BTE5_9PROT|nr:MATE family efflux transporter [Marinicauda salina]PWE17275.1 MATE family efflux transporter [Marinicauda salina]